MFNIYNYAMMRTCVLPNVLRQLSIYNVYNYSVPVADGVISRPNSARVLSRSIANAHTYCLYIHTYIYTYTHIHTCLYVHTYTHIHTHTRIHIYTYIRATVNSTRHSRMSLSLKPKYPLYVAFSAI